MGTVPSQVVDYIDLVYPQFADGMQHEPGVGCANGTPVTAGHQTASFKTLIDLVDRLDESVRPTGEAETKLVAAMNSLRTVLELFAGKDPAYSTNMKPVKGYNTHPVLAIHQVMSSLPDQAIPDTITGLCFIEDEVYRDDLRADIASVESLLAVKQWKATMVIAGSVMEALLLYTLLAASKDEAMESASRADLRCAKNEPDLWHLSDYVKVALDLKIISQTCASAALIAGDCRNLVHPGKELREEKKAARKDAYSAVAGLEHVLADVTTWWESRETPPVT